MAKTVRRSSTTFAIIPHHWLDLSHRALYAAVLAAYGWPQDLSDDKILARLLALNLERVKRQTSSE
jgi:hypothetical protein